eukprot:1140888-Pleurochrysis_carterae.AAC.1
MDATYLRAPVIRLPTSFFIVDPMHCLQLNIAKTLWKYSFGDRMLEPHRERVAEYLDSIDCAFDVRAKGSRNPEQKWFSAATVDSFVSGKQVSTTSKSPGLATNIWAIIKCVFDGVLPARQQRASGGSAAA